MSNETRFRNIAANLVLAAAVMLVVTLTNIPVVKSVFSSAEAPKAIYRGDPAKAQVSLMVNVYWGTEYLPGMLDALDKEGAKVTFFVGGSWVAQNEGMLKEIAARGHEIGSHGYHHKDHAKLSEAQNREELVSTHNLVRAVLGADMTLFAPPSGSFSRTTLSVAAALGYRSVMWSKDTIDWRDKDAALVFTRATRKLQNGDLILMHPTAHTLAALPRIVAVVKAAGFTPVTVSQNLSSARVQA
jgi:peptidoglycan/xylan/chitin deacetylase (PgdA/CDA1 family)